MASRLLRAHAAPSARMRGARRRRAVSCAGARAGMRRTRGDAGAVGRADAPDAAGAPAGQRTTPGRRPPATPSRPDAGRTEAQAKVARPASRLQPYPGAQRLGLRGGPARPAARPRRRPSPRLPAPPPQTPAPTTSRSIRSAISVGDLKLTPYVEEDVGWASNPGLVAGPAQGLAPSRRPQAGFALQSDWSRSDLHGALEGRLHRLFLRSHRQCAERQRRRSTAASTSRAICRSTPRAASTSATPDASPRSVSPPTSASVPPAPADRDLRRDARRRSEVRRSRLWRCTGRSTARSTATPRYSDGAVDDLSSDDFNDWGLRGARLLADEPGLSPVRRRAGRYAALRRVERPVTAMQRSSDGSPAVAGASSTSHKLTDRRARASATARATTRTRACRTSASPLIDASLIWSATPLTTVTPESAARARRDHPGRRGRRRAAYDHARRRPRADAAG